MPSSGTNRALGAGVLVAGLVICGFAGVATATKLGATTTTSESRNTAQSSNERAAGTSALPATSTTGAPTSPTTSSTTTSSTTTSAAPPSSATGAETPQQFLTDLARALSTNDTTFRVERLNPAVIKRFGEPNCRAFMNSGKPDPTAAFTIVSVSPPGDYDWATDGMTTTVPNTLTATVQRTAEGKQSQTDVHITDVNGRFTYYADCGTPQL